MDGVPRQQYTKKFREQAVRLVLAQQVPIPEAARRLNMSARRSSAGSVELGMRRQFMAFTIDNRFHYGTGMEMETAPSTLLRL